MKRLVLCLVITLCGALGAQALSYSDARREAWFLTDKMAYELNLTPEQCDVVYQINLDYFLSIRRVSDCRGPYWYYRNDDFRYVLSPRQFRIYINIDYFYYPIRWVRSSWYYPVVHYYHRDYYYFDRPAIYSRYHGSGWMHRASRSRSPYRSVTYSHSSVGLRDKYYSGGRRQPEIRYNRGTSSSGSSVRPSVRPSGSIFDRDKGASHGHSVNNNRVGRPSDRFGRDHNNGSNSFRPSREYGKDRGSSNSRVNKTERRDNTKRENHNERGSREFGR